MELPTINSIEEITNSNLETLAGIAQNLSMQDDKVIETITSSTILSPEIQQALELQDGAQLLADEPSGDTTDDLFESDDVDAGFGLLIFDDGGAAFGAEGDASNFWQRIKRLFSGLRKKVRRLFCEAVNNFRGNKDLDLKDILKKVLVIVIPAFAATSGLMPVVLPIVVSLAALLLKHGADTVCPI